MFLPLVQIVTSIESMFAFFCKYFKKGFKNTLKILEPSDCTSRASTSKTVEFGN